MNDWQISTVSKRQSESWDVKSGVYLCLGVILAIGTADSARAQASLAAPLSLSRRFSAPGPLDNEAAKHLAKAKAYYDSGQLRQAETEYQKALALKPSVEAYIGLGRVEQKLVGPAAARVQFEAAVKFAPNSNEAHRELGVFCFTNRDLIEANNELTRALQLDGNDQASAHALITLWQNQLAVAPNANSHFGLARAYQLSGALEQAKAEYREVVRLDPNNPALPAARQSFRTAQARQEAEKNLRQAEILESQGHLNDAYQLVAQAMVYSPGNSNYKLYQAELLTKLGQPVMAKQICINVLKDEPQNQTANEMLQLLNNYIASLVTKNVSTVSSIAQSSGQSSVQYATVPGTNIPVPPEFLQPTAAPVNQAAAAALPSAPAPLPATGINTLSSFLSQLRDKIFDQNDNQSGPPSLVSPVADPAGMLHGFGDGSIDPAASAAGRLNIGAPDTPAGGMGR